MVALKCIMLVTKGPKKLRFRVISNGSTLAEKVYTVSDGKPKLSESPILKYVSTDAKTKVSIEVEALHNWISVFLD